MTGGVRPRRQHRLHDYITRDNLVNSGRAFVQAFTDVIAQQIGSQ
jgi:hypothetical protein